MEELDNNFKTYHNSVNAKSKDTPPSLKNVNAPFFKKIVSEPFDEIALLIRYELLVEDVEQMRL